MTTTATCPHCGRGQSPLGILDECPHLAYACGFSRCRCPCLQRIDEEFEEFVAPMIEALISDGTEQLRDMLCDWATTGQAPAELLHIPVTVVDAFVGEEWPDDPDLEDLDPDSCQHEMQYMFVADMGTFAEELKRSVPATTRRGRLRE